MLLGSLRSGHTKDIEIAAPPPARGAAPPSQAPRVPSPRPRGPRDAEQRASSSALVELACHCGHDPALASPAGDPQVDAGPTLGRAPRACQRCGCADPAAGPREPALGLPAHPGRAEKARDVDVSDHDPNGSAAQTGSGRRPDGPGSPGERSSAPRPGGLHRHQVNALAAQPVGQLQQRRHPHDILADLLTAPPGLPSLGGPEGTPSRWPCRCRAHRPRADQLHRLFGLLHLILLARQQRARLPGEPARP